jgi:hypothetical protein
MRLPVAVMACALIAGCASYSSTPTFAPAAEATGVLLVVNASEYPVRGLTVGRPGEEPRRIDVTIAPGESRPVTLPVGTVEVVASVAMTGYTIPLPQEFNVRQGQSQEWRLQIRVDGDDAPPPAGATTGADAPQSPGHVTLLSSFERFGLSIEPIPAAEQTFDVSFAVTAEEPVELFVAAYPDGENEGTMLNVDQEGLRWECWYAFPESGRYELSISTRDPESTEKYYLRAASITIDATIPEGRRMLRWTGGDPPVRLIVSDVELVEEPWKAAATSSDSYNRAVVVGGCVLPGPVVDVEVRDGEMIRFDSWARETFSRVAVLLRDEVTVDGPDGRFTFAGGTDFSVSGATVRGTVAHGFDAEIAGLSLSFGPGAVATLTEGAISEVIPPGAGVLHYRGADLPMASIDRVHRSSGTLALVIAGREATVEMGGATISLPASARVEFHDGVVTRIYAWDEFSLVHDGEEHDVEFQIVEFDEDGAFSGIVAGK